MSLFAKRFRVAYAGLLASALVLGSASARAGYQWIPLGTGCGSAISVGPNNIPWVLGCPPGGYQWQVEWQTYTPVRVYYLTYSGSGFGSPQWIDANFDDARWLSVNLNGVPFVTDSNGQIWHAYSYDNNGLIWPSGLWGEWGGSGSYAAGNLVASVSTDTGIQDAEYFYPVEGFVNSPGYATFKFWAIGCGSYCAAGRSIVDGNLFEAAGSIGGYINQLSPWLQLPGRAQLFALFTDPPNWSTNKWGSNTVQNPWVKTGNGLVYFWTGSNWAQSSTPETMRYLTDHYALGNSGQLYYWTGNSSGSQGSWSAITVDASRVGGYGIAEIAWSQAASGSFEGNAFVCNDVNGVVTCQLQNIGPSQVWALDFYGHIYHLGWVGPIG